MSSYTKNCLSASTNGKQILLTAVTSASAQTIHTAIAGTSGWDEIFLYAYNDATASLSASILWGTGAVEPNDVTRYVLGPKSGRTMLVDGQVLQNGNVVYAYAEKASFININGFVNTVS